MPRKSDGIVSEPLLDNLLQEMCKRPIQEQIGELLDLEPNLGYAVSMIANHALEYDTELHPQQQAFRAAWRAALVAFHSYRRATFALWAGTALGTPLGKLDPAMAQWAAANPPTAAPATPPKPRPEEPGDGDAAGSGVVL